MDTNPRNGVLMDDAQKIALLKTGLWRDWICAEAMTWMWTPYQHKGRVKKIGVDCGGLLYEVYTPLLGPFKAFPEDYAPDWAAHKEGHELYLDFIMPYVTEVAAPIKGGFSLFHYGRNFSHAAIWIGDKYIHAFGRNSVGMVKCNDPAFFSNKGGQLRDVKHFDVSEQWLLCFSP
jgi:cell wall-associated NlpC family hydrolase